ncbi:MAG: hypothetical protein ACRCX2_32065 [Paraclostridium sp.]
MNYLSRVGKAAVGIFGMIIIEGTSSVATEWLREKSLIRKRKAIDEVRKIGNMTVNQVTKGYDLDEDDYIF